MDSTLGKRNFAQSDISTKYEIKFSLDGEACGPRTELWSGYLEENGEISMISGKSLLLKCSKDNWGLTDEGQRTGEFLLNIYQSNASKWVGFEPVHWNFNQPFRLSFVETKNVGYFVEVLTTDKKLVAKTPVIRLYTERWFREKTKRQHSLVPLKEYIIGEVQSDLASAQYRITNLGRKMKTLEQQLIDAQKEIEALKNENQKLCLENREMRQMLATFETPSGIGWEQVDPQSNMTSPPSNFDQSSPSFFPLDFSEVNDENNYNNSIEFGGELNMGQVTPEDVSPTSQGDPAEILPKAPILLNGGDAFDFDTFELPANPAFSSPSFGPSLANPFIFEDNNSQDGPPAKRFQKVFTPGGEMLLELKTEYEGDPFLEDVQSVSSHRSPPIVSERRHRGRGNIEETPLIKEEETKKNVPLSTQVFAKIVCKRHGLQLAVFNCSRNLVIVQYNLHFEVSKVESSPEIGLKGKNGLKCWLPLLNSKGTVSLRVIVTDEKDKSRTCVLWRNFEAPQKTHQKIEEDPSLEEDVQTFNMVIPQFPLDPESIEKLNRLSLKTEENQNH